jgi:hypothetical protein
MLMNARASLEASPSAPQGAAHHRPVRTVAGTLGWLGVILTLCLTGLWLWLAGQPGVAWSVAVTAFVVVPAALAGAAAARGDRRRAGSVAAAPASAPAVACTGRSGAVLALWDEDGRLVQEHAELATAGARAR